jgi:uroporphyrinogen-III decarboxylase
MLEKYMQCYQKYSNYSKIRAVIIPEDASTTLYSPQFFNDYIKPSLIQYCNIIKGAGKIAVMHACGHLKFLADSIKEIGLDCIESVTPYPVGNIVLDEFKQTLPGVCMMGGIHANAWLIDNVSFKDYVKDLILKNKKNGNFILSSSDSLPADAKMENIMSIGKLVEKYGKY